MNWIVAIAGFCNGAYVANLNIIFIRLSKNCFADVLSGSDICFLCFIGLPVRCGRNHTADMKNIVGSCYTLKDCIVIKKIAPNNFNIRLSNDVL